MPPRVVASIPLLLTLARSAHLVFSTLAIFERFNVSQGYAEEAAVFAETLPLNS
jgi:hypothetical protein